MMMLLKHLFKNLALWSLALCATVATADEPNAFTGAVDGNWFEAGNWSKETVPTADDDVLIDGKAVVAEGSIAARKLTISGASASLTLGKDDHSLTISANIAGDFLVTGGATLSVYPGELADYSTVFSTFAAASAAATIRTATSRSAADTTSSSRTAT